MVLVKSFNLSETQCSYLKKKDKFYFTEELWRYNKWFVNFKGLCQERHFQHIFSPDHLSGHCWCWCLRWGPIFCKTPQTLLYVMFIPFTLLTLDFMCIYTALNSISLFCSSSSLDKYIYIYICISLLPEFQLLKQSEI